MSLCNFEIPDVKFPGNKLKMPWELLQMNAEQLEKRRDELDALLTLASEGIARLHAAQAEALAVPLALPPPPPKKR